MKKIIAMAAAAIMAISSVGMSVSAFSDFSNVDASYLTDDSNLDLEAEFNGIDVRIYKDGTSISGYSRKTGILIEPNFGAEITADSLNLPDGYKIENNKITGRSETIFIETGSAEETAQVGELAASWVESNLAYEVTSVDGGSCDQCVDIQGMDVIFKDGSKTLFPVDFFGTIVNAYETYVDYLTRSEVKEIIWNTTGCATVHEFYDYETLAKNENGRIGDMDNNGSVNIYDIIGIAKYVLGTETFSAEAISRADFNGDGVTNLYDAIAIAKALLKA